MSVLGEDQTMIQVKVSKATKKRLKEIADISGIDLSALIRNRLQEAFRERGIDIDMWDAIGESGVPRDKPDGAREEKPQPTFDEFTQIQNVADVLKGLAMRLHTAPEERRTLLNAVSRLELADWNPALMRQALEIIEPCRLEIDDNWRAHIECPKPVNRADVLRSLIDRYIELTSEDE